VNIRPTLFLAGLLAASAALAASLGPYAPRFYFSTIGDDCYADGTLALSGECYALVWQRDGVPFRGFNATGTYGEGSDTTLPVDPANCQVLNVWPVAVKEWVDADPEQDIDEGYWTSYCPGASNIVSRQYYLDHRDVGTFSVYLFDTRKLVGSQTEVSGCDAATKTVPVLNGYGVIYNLEDIDMVPGSDTWPIFDDKAEFDPNAVPVYGDADDAFEVFENSFAATQSAVPTNAPVPCVSALTVGAGEVTLTVTNAPAYLRFNVVGAETPGELQTAPETVGAEKQGAATLEWTIHATAEKAFFRVIRQSWPELED